MIEKPMPFFSQKHFFADERFSFGAWENLRKGNIGNNCLVNIHHTDLRIHHAGHCFCSFRYKATGLHFECATSILGGYLVRITSGPWEPGTYRSTSRYFYH